MCHAQSDINSLTSWKMRLKPTLGQRDRDSINLLPECSNGVCERRQVKMVQGSDKLRIWGGKIGALRHCAKQLLERNYWTNCAQALAVARTLMDEDWIDAQFLAFLYVWAATGSHDEADGHGLDIT